MEEKKRKRLFLTSNMYPSKTNVRYGIFVKRFQEALENDFNIEKVVLTKKEGYIYKAFGYLVLYLKVIRLYFIADRKDLVYVHFPLYFSPLLAPFLWKRVPLILNFHGSDAIFDTRLKQFFSLWLKPIIRECHIVVPSTYYKEKVGKVFDISDRDFFVYPSGGVNVEIFYPIKSKKTEFVFGFVSNFIQKKGWAIFLEALAILKSSDTMPTFRAIMVGDGPDREKIVNDINLKELEVTILRSVEQVELAKVYAMFDVFIFPTYREAESLGLVGLEALMCGIPVIASKIAGPLGYMTEGYNGFLFEPKDSKALAGKMMQYMSLTEVEIEKMKRHSLRSTEKYESKRVKSELLEWLKTK